MTPRLALGLADRQQRRRDIGEHREGARFARLVFKADVDLGIVVGDLADRLDLHGPERRVIDLERVIEPVLPEPERHRAPAHRAQRVDALARQVDGLASHRRVRVGESPALERGIGVVAHRETVQHQVSGRKPLGHFALGVTLEVIREVQVDGVEARHRGGAIIRSRVVGLPFLPGQ